MTLICSENEKEITVSNDQYVAVINKKNGELVSVSERDGKQGKLALAKDQFRITLTNTKETFVTTEQKSIKVDIEENYDFYVKISSLIKIPSTKTDLYLKRTYEFTRNKNIYEQAVFYSSTNRNKKTKARTSLLIRELDWIMKAESTNVHVCRTADDLYVKQPNGPLGGLDSGLVGFKFKSNFTKSDPIRRSIVAGGLYKQTKKRAILPEGRVFLICSAIQIGSKNDEPITSEDFERDEYQFYPGFGIRTIGWKKNQDKMFNFTNWNKYALSSFVPILNPKFEDFLLRCLMHLCNRMKFDGGWPKTPKWSPNYPNGDIFTAHARGFPFMLQLWAMLALKWNGTEFIHQPSDADVFYEQLQETYKFFLASNPVNFYNTYGPNKIPYISYSATRKDNKAKGVLNTHAHALHFAWLMIEASRFFGDKKRAKEWDTLVKKYHAGSKALFKKLYPHAKDGKKVSGFVRYSIDGFNYTMDSIHYYNSISYEGIAAGYIDSMEYEAEFVDAVERASQPHLDYNPWFDDFIVCGDAPFKARLCRILPLALIYTDENLVMSSHIQAASIDEVLKYKKEQEFTHSDQNKYIVEGDGKTPRKYIKTNKIFTSDWVSGYWEEKESEEIPDQYQFEITVSSSNVSSIGHYAAYRMGNLVQIMTNFDNADITLTFPTIEKDMKYITSSREYDEKNVCWKDEVKDSLKILPSQSKITFNNISKKCILSIYFQ